MNQRKSLNIGIDARFVGPQGTGLGKYTEKLILNLAKIDTKNHYKIFLRENNWFSINLNKYKQSFSSNKNFTKVLADVAWYSVEEQYKMPAIFKSQNLELLHVPHFNVPILYRGKFVVTIHDLIHHKFSESTATTKNPLVFMAKRFGYKRVIEHAIYKSQKIITPSNFVKEDILKNFKVDPKKIVVTYEAAEEEYFNKRSTINDKQSTLIYVGNAYPHKNLTKLLDAIRVLNTKYKIQNTKLIIVSPRDVFTERLTDEINKRNLQSKVELKGYMKPEDLAQLFQKAKAYVFPSLSEGFGIPGLNAMAAGIPVISSNIPVLKEIYGDAAIYFDPEDEKDIAQKIKKVLQDSKTRLNLVKKGHTQVQQYSWLKMAQQTLEVYNKI